MQINKNKMHESNKKHIKTSKNKLNVIINYK